MGQQFAFLCQTHRIDTVRLEHQNRQVRTDGNNHQRQEKVVSTGKFRNQEHTGKRCMHDTRHNSRHPQQRKILLGNIHGEREIIGSMRKKETGNTAQIQAWCKDTTASPAGIGRTRGKHFSQQNQEQEYQYSPVRIIQIIEQTLIHYMGELPVQQRANRVVTFTIQRREKEDKHTQHNTAEQELLPVHTQLAVHPFHPVHHPCKIKGNQSAEDAQQQHVRDTFYLEHFCLREFKHRFRPRKNIGNRRRRHR